MGMTTAQHSRTKFEAGLVADQSQRGNGDV